MTIIELFIGAMETSVKYEVDKPIYPENKREQVLRSPYFQCVASTADSMIMAVGLCTDPEQHEAIIRQAIAHIENTFETIRDKTAVFLYQLPKQPIEQLGQRYSDEFLEKQKQENERIDKEKEDPRYFQEVSNAMRRIKQALAKKSSQ